MTSEHDDLLRILACRPIDLDPGDMFDQITATHTFVYTDSVEGVCTWCQRRVWIGPRAQAAHSANPTWPIACFLCAVINSADNPTSVRIHSLGNPETI